MKKIIASFVVSGLLLSNPLVSNAALGDRTLKSGMTHTEVKQLQEILKKKEYFKSLPKKVEGRLYLDKKNKIVSILEVNPHLFNRLMTGKERFQLIVDSLFESCPGIEKILFSIFFHHPSRHKE